MPRGGTRRADEALSPHEATTDRRPWDQLHLAGVEIAQPARYLCFPGRHGPLIDLVVEALEKRPGHRGTQFRRGRHRVLQDFCSIPLHSETLHYPHKLRHANATSATPRTSRAPAPQCGCCADEGSAAVLPETRAAFHMNDRQDQDLIILQAVDDVVGEACHQHAAALRVFVGGRSDLTLALDALDRRVDGVIQLSAQAGPTRLIPAHGFGELLGRGPSDPDAALALHRPRIVFSIRRFTSAHDSSLSLPASRSATRRAISACQACSASGSPGPSRLASISAASWARESASSLRASASTASVAFVMPVIYAEAAPPNNPLHLTAGVGRGGQVKGGAPAPGERGRWAGRMGKGKVGGW